MEHLWLAIAAECVNSLWSNTSSHNRSFITEHVGLLLQDQLTDLCRFYDEIPETKQASHQAGTLDVSQLALGLWNTDLAAEEVWCCLSLACLACAPISTKAVLAPNHQRMVLQSSGDDDEPEPRRSRLLIGLDQAQIQQLALLTVTCGIAVIASRPQVVRKSVMPLQPELLQALLLQGIRLVPEADTVSIVPDLGDAVMFTTLSNVEVVCHTGRPSATSHSRRATARQVPTELPEDTGKHC